MPIEFDLGRLIIQLNPYTDGQRNPIPIENRMHFDLTAPPAAAPAAPPAIAPWFVAAAPPAVGVAPAAPPAVGVAPAAPPAVAAGVAAHQAARAAALALLDLGQFQLEVDNYEGAWTFKGATFRVTRAVRIVYRYPLRNARGAPNGLYATENLLVGYAGGNGS